MDDALVTAILSPQSKLELRVPVRWEDRGPNLRANMGVHNAHSRPLFVGMQITKDKPWKPTAYLMLNGVQLRRLDVNATHTNPTDRQRWKWQTHKHRWTEIHQDTVAYTPTDIPDVPFSGVTVDHLRGVFEAFLSECQITQAGTYAWNDPDLTPARHRGKA